MDDLQEKLLSYNELLNVRLRKMLEPHPPAEPLYQMIAYHFGWLNERLEPSRAGGGKRLRPAICFLACEAVGASADMAVPGALAVELIHNFSLVHDDIEDTSHLRRRRPTVWSIWGVAQGVNVGDALFTLAHTALIDPILEPWQTCFGVRALARTCIALCEGQFLDMTMQSGADPDISQYLTMIRKKTGALFGCAAELGALMGGARADAVDKLGQFGCALGEAFQIQDDILGIWGDEAETGKPTRDIRERKLGIPIVIAWQRASAEDLSRLSALYAQQEPPGAAEELWVRRLLDRLGARREAEMMAQERLRRAEKLFDEAAAECEAARQMHQLIDEIAQRCC